MNEAALFAARKGKSAAGMEEFNEGVERVTAGLEKKQRITRTLAAQVGVPVVAVRARAVADSPLGRLTTPEEVAWAIARLADPEAAALTGSTLLVDGGRRRALP